MTYQATTRGSLIRGTTQSPLGDTIDANGGSPVAGASDAPVGLIERSKTVLDPASGQRRTVRVLAARVPYAWPYREGDRLRDDRTGIIYAIDEAVKVPRSLAGQASLTLDLRKLGEVTA